MKFYFLLFALLTFCGIKAEAKSLHNWGQATNPDRDCKFFLDAKELLISVPGTSNPHDLAAEIGVTNAPCILQSVRGDFTLQVRTDGRFDPGHESSQSGRFAYNGAGLVVMFDSSNVLTFARAALQQSGRTKTPYANFELRHDGKLERIGLTSDHPLPQSGPLYLQLQRRGQNITAAVSTDGIVWDIIGSKLIPDHWPKKLKAGVIAISTSLEEFNPRFSELKIRK